MSNKEYTEEDENEFFKALELDNEANENTTLKEIVWTIISTIISTMIVIGFITLCLVILDYICDYIWVLMLIVMIVLLLTADYRDKQ